MIIVPVGVFNPSPYKRTGVLKLNLQNLHQDHSSICCEAKVLDADAAEIESQVETLDSDDPSTSSLLVAIEKPLAAGLENYAYPSTEIQVQLGAVGVARTPESTFSFEEKKIKGVRVAVLSNSRMEIEIALDAKVGGKRCFGGAIRKVQLKRVTRNQIQPYGDVLFLLNDDLREFTQTQPQRAFELSELRSLQVDKLYVWDDEQQAVVQLDVFDSDFDVAAWYRGSLRVGVTLASHKVFELAIADEGGLHHTYCRLYRHFSLDRDADFVLDRMWVRPLDRPGQRLEFRVRLFNFLFWPELEFQQTPQQVDWLAIRCGSKDFTKFPQPFQSLRSSMGYGTDAHTRRFRNHPYWPASQSSEYCVSWETGPSRLVTSAVKFMFTAAMDECAHAIGQIWYERLFKPIRGKKKL